MEHFTNEEWIDFVNQTAPQRKQEAMRKHLATGCKGCEENLALWQKVRSTAGPEAKFQPPLETVRVVKSSFAAAGLGRAPKKSDALIELLFDSLLQPALGGARSAATGPRQMLYRAESYQIDVQIEAKPGSNRVMITGQIMDVGIPEMVSRQSLVTLSDGRGNAIALITNEFGEFRGEIENSGDLELSVTARNEAPIKISLRHALGDLPGAKA